MDELNRYDDEFDAYELEFKDRQRTKSFRRARVERKALEKARKDNRNVSSL